MRILLIALLIACAFFSSSVSGSSFNRHPLHDELRHHLKSLQSQVKDSGNTVLSAIRQIKFHTEAAIDCENALRGVRTESNVKACLSVQGAASFSTNCQANLLSLGCTLDITAAFAIYSGGSTPAPANECQTAIQSYTSNLVEKCKPVMDGLSAVGNGSPSDVINAQCKVLTGSIYQQCVDAITSTSGIQKSCPNFKITEILAPATSILAKIQGPISAMCIKDYSGNNCIASVLPSFNTLDNFSYKKASSTFLDSMCKKCMINVVNAVAALGGSVDVSVSSLQKAIDYLQLLCIKDPTDQSKYCVNNFFLFDTINTNFIEAKFPSQSDLDNFCSPCFNVIGKIVENTNHHFGLSTCDYRKLSDLCKKDTKTGKSCGSFLLTAEKAASVSASLAVCKNQKVICTAECQAAMEKLEAESCCYTAIDMGTMNYWMNNSSPLLVQQFSNLMSGASCAYNFSQSCLIPPPPAITKIPFDLSFPNIDSTAALGENATRALKDALLFDLSLPFGLDDNDVIIGDITAAGTGGTKISITINGESFYEAGYKSNIVKRITSGEIPFKSTAKASSDNQIKIMSSASISSSPADIPNNNPSPSNALAVRVSMIAIALPIIVALFSDRF